MAVIDQDRLNAQVIAAVDMLARSLSHYLAGVRVEERGDYCEIMLVNPHDPEQPIYISTNEGEITVAFGECHEHFNSCIDETDEAGLVVELVAKVTLIACGAEVSYSAWENDNCLGGGWHRTGTDNKEVFDDFQRANRLKIVGWAPSSNTEICRHQDPS